MIQNRWSAVKLQGERDEPYKCTGHMKASARGERGRQPPLPRLTHPEGGLLLRKAANSSGRPPRVKPPTYGLSWKVKVRTTYIYIYIYMYISLTRKYIPGTEYARAASHIPGIWYIICEFSQKWDIDETYCAACKVEYRLFWSVELTADVFYNLMKKKNWYRSSREI